MLAFILANLADVSIITMYPDIVVVYYYSRMNIFSGRASSWAPSRANWDPSRV